MRSKQDTEKLFKLIREDAQSWLAQAKQLRLSANVIFLEWEKIIQYPPSNLGVQEKMLAYSKSFMLLTGFAFENLLKGILYGRDSNSKLARNKGGHGIVEMAKGIITLSSAELNLLERLETYLRWAGRYRVPLSPEVFHESQEKVSITTEDSKIIDQLFRKLEQILREVWKGRGNY
jgi:hypothetical protein